MDEATAMAARTQSFNEGRSHIHAAVGDP